MNTLELLGRTATAYLSQRIAADEAADSTARFLLDRLTGPQVAAICRELLRRPALAAQVRMRIPREFGQGANLPADVLTDERTTHWRHAACDRPVLLLANTDDDQGQSLKDITPIGSMELLSEPQLWVAQASDALGLLDQDRTIWERALKGLQESRPVSLEVFATFVLQTRTGIEEHGLPLLAALGWALPALRIPRDTALFNAIPERTRTHTSSWKRCFTQCFTKRAAYLLKLTPTHQLISNDQLNEMWNAVSNDVAPHHHPIVEAFINAPSKWTPEAEALAGLEWERDNIKSLFDGLRPRSFPLGQSTLDFYEDELPDTLTDEEQDYLRRLDARRTREPNEDDEGFYGRHRIELGANRPLKSRWDRFVFGQPIEADDFSIGLLQCLERLFEQANPTADSREITIEAHRKAPRDWLDLNYESVSYFSRRYRGLRTLTNRAVTWDVGDLFQFEQIVARQERRNRFQRTHSSAKAANQIRFYITLESTTGDTTDTFSSQLIWHFNPDGITAEYSEDWRRLAEHPFLFARVSREPVSKKGKLQAIDLADVTTLMPVFRQDRGSLIPAYRREDDAERILPQSLTAALQGRRITAEGYQSITLSWSQFADAYRTAITDFFAQGVSAPTCLEIEQPYVALIESLHQHAPGDSNRRDLWEPILKLGVAQVDGGAPAAIVAPWHPLRLLGVVVKARQLAGLINHLVNADSIDFGDAHLFFQDLEEELLHPYYPDVCVGTLGTELSLLARTDTYGDYSLMESPVVRDPDDDSTNENPTATAREVLALVKRYLALQPHESTNLSIVLYNCNSARLPEATVNVLGELYDEDEEVRCQVILRHHNAARLHELYEKILEGSDGDTDSFVASEASRDFMARLRIGIMADSAPIPNAQDGPPIDIVFLQDVIARLAELVWLQDPVTHEFPQLLHHAPPRCSRRRPGTMDDQRSVVYLTAPIQPLVSWRYLQATYSVLHGTEVDLATYPLPARQISFQHNITRSIFEEVHRLGQWVVNSDDLLTRRQLRNQGVHIIRHQQHRYDDRSLTISSKAPLNLLEVLVLRRLHALNLGLDDANLQALTRQLVTDASLVSGDIVLRAAKRGEFASELIGVVLSKFLLENEIGTTEHCGWYFLDDYAAWLGQREEHLADILALSPQRNGDRRVLVAVVGESKFITSTAVAESRRTSAVQLRETLERIQEALFGSPSRLDRDLWLSRLADVILDGIEVPATEGALLHEWRDAIRSGEVDILLKGYSHVFVHTQRPEDSDPSERVPVAGVQHAFQEIYGRDRVRAILLAYQARINPLSIRQQLGDDEPWSAGVAARPSNRVTWTAAPRTRSRTAPRAEQQPPAELQPQEPDVSPPPPTPPEPRPARSQREEPAPPTPPPPSTDHYQWAFPRLRETLSRLASTLPPTDDDEAWLRDTVHRLRTALLSYNLQARILGQRLTPNAALIRFQGSDRLRVSDVEHRRNELLTTHGLQVTTVLAEPAQVVVCVARPRRQLVSLLEAWRDRTVDQTTPLRINQSLVVGVREADGNLLYLRPGEAHAPHSLVAGTTGSGKSVLIQNLILDIAATNDCAQARIVLIDPKQGADYLDLQGLPHIQGDIIVTQDAAHAALEAAVLEMERRYQLFRTAGVANISRYNAAAAAADRLPVLWLVHDEFAVWMLVDHYRDTVANTVQRLGVMARAAGIFLIFAAQRPEDRVMPVQLRDNLGNRLVLRVESPGTSMISLGEEGAERLLGRGHLAARLQGEDSLIFAQVPILTAEQIREIVACIRDDARTFNH
jgi:S-DNA-T family DNA segregation ATPase FtsK/SpoIIIE